MHVKFCEFQKLWHIVWNYAFEHWGKTKWQSSSAFRKSASDSDQHFRGNSYQVNWLMADILSPSNRGRVGPMGNLFFNPSIYLLGASLTLEKLLAYNPTEMHLSCLSEIPWTATNHYGANFAFAMEICYHLLPLFYLMRISDGDLHCIRVVCSENSFVPQWKTCPVHLSVHCAGWISEIGRSQAGTFLGRVSL